MTGTPGTSPPGKDHQAFLQEINRNIRRIMEKNYKLKKVTIQPISAGASRLSNPIEITGVNEKGETIRYFGKVIGSSDILSFHSIQFLNLGNLYFSVRGRFSPFLICQ